MMNRLKTIAVDLTPLLPGGENGGAKIFVLELVCQLAKLAPETEFILLTQFASHHELEAIECKNIRALMVLDHSVKTRAWFATFTSILGRLPYVPRQLGALGYRINRLLKRRQAHSLLSKIGADLLFCPFTAPIYFEPGIPTVSVIYDLQYKTYPRFFSPTDVIHRDHTFKEACRRASMLAAISEYSRQSAIKHGGLQPEKIRSIPIQMARRILPATQQDRSTLSRFGLAAEHYLLYPANFWKHKNHEMLLTAFNIACQGELPETLKLVCTGAENARQSWLIEAVARMNLNDRVLFVGFLSNAELAILMSNSRAVIFPSLYEGFGLPIIEAMAAGVPVACSNLTSLPEIAADAALTFNPRRPTEIAEAILSLSRDEMLRKRLIEAGKARAKVFSDSRQMAQSYWDLFQEALGGIKQEDNLVELSSGTKSA